MKKILYSDRSENLPVLETEEKPIIDIPQLEEIKTAPVLQPAKKSNAMTWVIIAVVVILLVVALTYYLNLKRKENENN